jgi:hypothetical protein
VLPFIDQAGRGTPAYKQIYMLQSHNTYLHKTDKHTACEKLGVSSLPTNKTEYFDKNVTNVVQFILTLLNHITEIWPIATTFYML